MAFIDAHGEEYGVEPICRELPIAPSSDSERKARQADPERLMRAMELTGVVRERKCCTTIADDHAGRPLDLVNRQFQASRPNELWMADFAYAATWAGFVYAAFVVDGFSRRLIGRCVPRSMNGELAAEAVEQHASGTRAGVQGVVRPSDRGSQYLSVRYSERLAEVYAQPSVGSVGDSYDNALAETIIRLYKTEVIHRRGPWGHLDAVEYATLQWADWFNHRRLLEPIGNVPPAQLEASYHRSTGQLPMAASLKLGTLRKSRGGSCARSLVRLPELGGATMAPTGVGGRL